MKRTMLVVKRSALVVLCLVLILGCATPASKDAAVEERPELIPDSELTSIVSQSDDWTKADVYRESAYFILHVADWRQTLYISKHPDEFFEKNPILGAHPSDSEVNRYFIATGLLHVAASHYLPKAGRLLPETWQRNLYVDHWRKAFQYSTIFIEADYVYSNYRAGIKIFF